MKNTSMLQSWAAIGAILLSASTASAINILTVQDPEKYGSKYGYIDEATLVVEPHGGYVEQSLYLTYSDHGQYQGNDKIEIVHRFELPQGSAVNDLWLWMGNDVMKATVLDVWTARAVYDSIVQKRHDPAFLSQNGSQYELHIYPLSSGSYRKIKLNFISPTQWMGNQATAQLPFLMLRSNNAPTRPLDIMFRTQEPIWGQPVLLEQPENEFGPLADSLGYHFELCYVPDISTLNHMNIAFETDFTDGCFYEANQTGDEASYFEIGLMPQEFFHLNADTSAQRWFVGLDLSGRYNRRLSILVPEVEMLLSSCLRGKDLFHLCAVGAGDSMQVTDTWYSGTDSIIAGALTAFKQSALGQELQTLRFPHIVYCDKLASTCWQFPGIEVLAL